VRELLHDGQVIVNVLRIQGDLVCVRVPLVDTIARILHREHVHLEHIFDECEQLHSQSHILSIPMEVDQKFRTASKVWQIEARNETELLLRIDLLGLPCLLINPLHVFFERVWCLFLFAFFVR